MNTEITKGFKAAKRAAKKVIKAQGGTVADVSAVHGAAIKALTEACPEMIPALLADLSWEAVKAAR